MSKTCVIFDIDGTLADISHRLHHITGKHKNWDKFFDECVDDGIINHTFDLLNSVNLSRHDGYDPDRIFYCSGRPDSHRKQTSKWMFENMPCDFNDNDILMRRTGDHRADTIVKKEMLDYIRGQDYHVLFAVDDRPSVIEMWRNNGVPCFDVGNEQWGNSTQVDVTDKLLLTLMVGPTHAGKTTYLQDHVFLSDVLSSDDLREEMTGDRNDQTMNDGVFQYMHELVHLRAKYGLHTYVDATNIRNKDRRAFVDQVPNNAKIKYVVIDRPLEVKLKDRREGFPEDVIKRHDNTFKSNLKDILNGDGYDNVIVEDLRSNK